MVASDTSTSVASGSCVVTGESSTCVGSGASDTSVVVRVVDCAVNTSSAGVVLLDIVKIHVLVVADVQTQSTWVNVAVAKEQKSTEADLGKQVKHTVEPRFLNASALFCRVTL